MKPRDLFRELSAVIPHTSDEEHHNYIRELIAARDWATQNGIRFEWVAADRVDADYLCLKANVGGKLVGQSSEWHPKIGDRSTKSRRQRDLAECLMSQCLKNGINDTLNAGGYMVCDLNGIDPATAAAQLDHSHEIDEDVAFDALYEAVHRYSADDDHHTARIHAMIAAALWAQAVGIEFTWEATDTRDEDEPDQPTCRCLAYRNEKILGTSEDWYEATMRDPSSARRWAEYELALAVMGEFDNPRDDYIRVGDDLDPADRRRIA